MRKSLKKENKNRSNRRKSYQDNQSDSEYDSDDSQGQRRKSKNRDGSRNRNKGDKSKKKKDLFSVSTSSESENSSDEEEKGKLRSKRPGSALRRPGSAMSGSRMKKHGRHNGSSESETDSDLTRVSDDVRPRSADRRSFNSQSRFGDKEDTESDGHHRSKYGKYDRNNKDRRSSSASRDRNGNGVPVNATRRMSTSASSLRQNQEQTGRKKGGKGELDDDLDILEVKKPLYEECVFMCNRWLAADEDDGLSVRELKVSERQTFYKENY